MSRNVLHQYNSYSYHHFLLIAKDSEAADKLTADSDIFFKFVTGDEAMIDGVRVLVNPLKSVKYIIQELEMNNVVDANLLKSDQTSLVTFSMGSMQILEPHGIDLFNDIYETYKAIGASATSGSAVWMIKTIFVGNKDVPHSGAVDYITNIRPMAITPVDIVAEYSEGGGKYDMQFVMQMSGAGLMRGTNSNAITLGTSFKLASTETEGATMASALQTLENKINSEYELQYKINQASNGGVAQPKVKYKINLADHWKDGKYKIKGSADQSDSGDSNDVQFSAKTGERLDQTIGRIMSMCPEFERETVDDGTGMSYYSMIQTSQDVLEVTEENGYRTVEHFNILRKEKSSKTWDQMSSSEYIEYNYLYTGKNVDVLSFDMKMNLGFAFMETVIANANNSTLGQNPGSSHNQSAIDPPLVGTIETTPVRNSKMATDATSLHSVEPQYSSMYQQLLKQHVAMETIAINITIAGDPQLFDDLVPSKSAITQALARDYSEQPATTEQSSMSNWLTKPLLMKINVMMPTDDKFTSFKPFWYDGLYRVLEVKNIFAGGQFTQEMFLVAHNTIPRPIVQDDPQLKQAPEDDVEQNTVIENIPPSGDRIPIAELQQSRLGLELIQVGESRVLTPYKDVAGLWTIGWGHLITTNEAASGTINIKSVAVPYVNGLTPEQCDDLLAQDCGKAISAIKNNVRVPMYQREYDALISFVFNVGPGGIATSTLRKVLNAGDYEGVPGQMRQWNKITVNGQKVVSKGLNNRRAHEIKMWEYGIL